MDEFTITLNSPLTEEQWDMIADYDFEHTDRIWFHTKHGKEVEFVKRKTGKWIHTGEEHGPLYSGEDYEWLACSECGHALFLRMPVKSKPKYCEDCGCKMEG